jgi:monofunctional biosynthetic peptidoglycan transglycosylase
VAEGARLESVFRGNSNVSSNLIPSARYFYGNVMKFFILLRNIALIYLIGVLSLGVLYLIVPPVSTLMVARLVTFQNVTRDSVPISDISSQLIRSVIRAEDSKFCQHYGVDWESMGNAIEDKNGRSLGASTIPMQVAKNLFLWPHPSYLRKAIEVPIAIYLNAIWPKYRMMEVYLSIAEWGDGIYGIEAASQTYFHKHAKQLNASEAALLAAMLPNPLKRNPTRPSRYHLKYANNIQKWANGGVDISCVRK